MTRIILFSFFITLSLSTDVAAAVVAPPPAEIETTILSRADLEAELGRKLTFRERLAVKALKRQHKKQARKAAAEGSGNGMAIAGFVCGVVGLFVAGIILGILAIIFGAIGMRRSKERGLPLKGLAIAGFVCGIVGVVGAVIVLAAM